MWVFKNQGSPFSNIGDSKRKWNIGFRDQGLPPPIIEKQMENNMDGHCDYIVDYT